MTDTIIQVITNTQLIEIIAMIVGLCYSYATMNKTFAEVKEGKLKKVIQAVDEAVRQVYVTYVRDLKTASEDGKLTPEEKIMALNKAKILSIDLAKTKGIDLVQEIGHDLITYYIEESVTKAKGSIVKGTNVV